MEAKWFASRLRELREGKGLARDELAELAGMKPTAVRDIEQGVYSPNWETVVALCRALGVTADAFLVEPAERPPVGRGRPRKGSGPGAVAKLDEGEAPQIPAGGDQPAGLTAGTSAGRAKKDGKRKRGGA